MWRGFFMAQLNAFSIENNWKSVKLQNKKSQYKGNGYVSRLFSRCDLVNAFIPLSVSLVSSIIIYSIIGLLELSVCKSHLFLVRLLMFS